MANEAFFTDGGDYVAAEFRRLLKTFYYADDARGGVIYGLAVVPGAGSGVKVQVGAATVNDSGGGAYVGATQSDATVPITPASGAARTDTVYAIIQDPGSGATAGEMAFGKSEGSTSIPSLAIPLARLTVNMDGSIVITDLRSFVQSAAVHGADTGWVPLTLLNGWASGPLGASTQNATIRRRDNVVQLLGAIREPANFAYRLQDPVDMPFTLPGWAVPLYTQRFALATNADAGTGSTSIYGMGQLWVDGSTPLHGVAGNVRLFMPSDVGGPNVVYLNATWLVD